MTRKGLLLVCLLLWSGCADNENEPPGAPGVVDRTLDESLRDVLKQRGIDGDPISGRGFYGDGPWDSPTQRIQNDPVAQLGMQLFYTTHLSGQDDTACVSCHVNTLGGGDGIPLSIGPGAQEPALIGPGRAFFEGTRGKPVPRNAPTMFNTMAWDHCILQDCRIEALGGAPLMGGDDGNGISTPFIGHGREDVLAGPTLLEAHLPFPMNSEVVMRGLRFPEMETYEYGDCLAEKLAGVGDCGALLRSVHDVSPNVVPWPVRFAEVFDPNFDHEYPPGVDAVRDWVTFDRIKEALVAYEEVLTFVETPLKRYLSGDDSALAEQQKRGALWFFLDVDEGGAGCASCHSGDLFSDEKHHNVGLVQIGPGKTHDIFGDGDWGRGAINGNAGDRFKFRTPTLLNVTVTGPWGHHGAYNSLHQIIEAHIDPVGSYEEFDFSSAPFTPSVASSRYDTEQALRALQNQPGYRFVDVDDQVIDDVVAFLEALTDPCVEDRTCLAPFDPFNARLDDDNMGLLHPVDQDGCSLVEINPSCDNSNAEVGQ